jgi:peptide/nickel transport system substrate-binding protein
MHRKSYLVLLLVAVMALVVAGAAPTLAQDGDIPRGGTVNINESPQGATWPGPNFNPYAPSPRQGTTALLYEPLTIFNAPDGGTPTPWLAEDVSYSEDLMTLVVKLREGVKWSDGEDFNADDLVFTVNLLQEFSGLDRPGLWAIIDGVEKVDDFTVNFALKEVYTQADTVIGRMYPLPEHVWSTIEDPVTFLNEDPVTTGPFSELEYSDAVYTICRNPNYWQEGKPYVDCVRYPAFADNAAVNNAMINGDLDWTGNFIPDIQNTFVAKDPENLGFDFYIDGQKPIIVYLNTTKAPFDDTQFRIALSQAIDYEGIPDIVYGPGYAGPFNPTGLSLGRYADWINQEALDKAAELGVGAYDPERAKATLDAAGYAVAADGWRTNKDGSPLEIQIQTVNGWTDWTVSAQVIAQNWQDIGLNTSIVTPEFGTWFADLQQANYDASMGWSDYIRTPWDFYRNLLDSSLVLPIDGGGTTAAGTAWARFFSPRTDELLKAFTQTTDDAEKKEIIGELQMFMVENVPFIPFMGNAYWYEWNTTRFVGFPMPGNMYTIGSPWDNLTGGALLTVLNLHCKDATSCGQE